MGKILAKIVLSKATFFLSQCEDMAKKERKQLAKSLALKDAILFLAEHESFSMRPVLRKALNLSHTAEQRRKAEDQGRRSQGKAQGRSGSRRQLSDESGDDMQHLPATTVENDNEDTQDEVREARQEEAAPSSLSNEARIMCNDPSAIAVVKDKCAKINGKNYGNSEEQKRMKAKHFDKILSDCFNLDFPHVKFKLLEFLANRAHNPGSRSPMPPVWNMSNLHAVAQSIKVCDQVVGDARIHKAFAQMKFYQLVRPRLRDRSIDLVLSKLADQKSGDVSKSEKKERRLSYKKAYNSGQKWSEIARWFHGSGIVFVFVIAEISTYSIEAGWSLYQRRCLKVISKCLENIKGLVKVIGQDSLQEYCQFGKLSDETRQTIEEFGAEEESEDEEEMIDDDEEDYKMDDDVDEKIKTEGDSADWEVKKEDFEVEIEGQDNGEDDSDSDHSESDNSDSDDEE